MKKSLMLAIAAVLVACPALMAQWVKIPMAGVPRTADGKVNLSAPAPRQADGKPDLSGIWEADATKYLRNLGADIKEEDFPFQPAARALFNQRADGSHSREDPDANCLPQGIPKLGAAPAPWKIVNGPGFIAILHEAFNLWRQIFLDGREVAADPTPTWLGYSTGKWQGDTLVVDTKGFNGKAWLDQLGRPSTDALHVIERFHRKDFGHMDIEITIDDPKAYTKPWSLTEGFHLNTNTELMEFICNENNLDIPHLPGNK